MQTRQFVLLLIDIQQGLTPSANPQLARNNPHAEQQAGRLLAHWRQRAWPRIHVKHNSIHPTSNLYPGKAGNQIQAVVAPEGEEPVLEKSVNAAFVGTSLGQRLAAMPAPELVMVGLTTDHCVSSTARMACDLGYRVCVVSDATATFERKRPGGERLSAAMMHEAALASLQGEFAEVLDTEQVLKWVEAGK